MSDKNDKRPNKRARHDESDSSDEDENFALNNESTSDIDESYVLSSLRRPPKKHKGNQPTLSPIVTAHINTRLGKPKIHRIKVLLDSGASATIITKEHVKKLRLQHSTSTTWNTKAGNFTTNATCKIKFSLPEFYENRLVDWTAHVDDSDGPHKYDMIVGRDLLENLGLVLNFADKTVCWGDSTVLMKDPTFLKQSLTDYQTDNFYWHNDLLESEALRSATDRLKKILDAKYEKTNLEDYCSKCTHLSHEEQYKLLNVLRKHATLFDGTLGRWDGCEYDIEVKPDATPYHARPFPIPKIREPTDLADRTSRSHLMRTPGSD